VAGFPEPVLTAARWSSFLKESRTFFVANPRSYSTVSISTAH
jgi:hypothetical protein